jgi:hypothetical protein
MALSRLATNSSSDLPDLCFDNAAFLDIFYLVPVPIHDRSLVVRPAADAIGKNGVLTTALSRQWPLALNVRFPPETGH